MIDNITLDNLHIGCKASNKAEVIAMIGAEFKAKGYVNQECVHFLLEREHQVSLKALDTHEAQLNHRKFVLVLFLNFY